MVRSEVETMNGQNLDVESESRSDPGAITVTHAGSRTGDAAAGRDDTDPLLDLLEQWDECYGRGEDVAPESLGITDPVLLAQLRERIKKQKWLYEHLNPGAEPTDGAAGVDESSPSFPGHETLGKIGQGGMGIVYKARDKDLGRIVAIKTIAEGQHASAEQRERFRGEAQAVARLRHPNIIAIHAIGVHENRPYLSLEFAEGGSLAQRLAEKPMAPGEAAGLIETLARAVQAAHQAGVVHRDLKPSNVLLTAEGVPKVSDFGLAKLLDADSAPTLSGQVLGSPSYMAPEQAGGHSKEVGPAADIYALGAILYHSLTGRPPFLGGSAIETLNLVVSTEVVSPRRLRPDVPRDLETICLKCLEKEPQKRYASALALADDLRRFLDGRPIDARPLGPWERSWRWCRRNPKLAGLAAALLLTFALGTPTLLWLWVRARFEQSRAETERDHAQLARNQMFAAVNAILLTDQGPLQIEEMRPYREALIDKGLQISQDILSQLSEDSRGKAIKSEALIARAKLLGEKGDRAQAYRVGQEAVALYEGLLARDPNDIQGRDSLAQLFHQLSTVSSDHAKARSAAERSNEILRALLREHGQAEKARDWLGGIALNSHNIGHNFFEDADAASGALKMDLLHKAIDAFEEARRFCDARIQRGHQDDFLIALLARIERYLCRSYRVHASQLNDPARSATRLNEAIEYGKKAVLHFQNIADRNPDHFQYSWELFETQRELGLLHLDTRQWEAAISPYEIARATLKKMAQKHGVLVSRMAQIQGALAEVDNNLAMVRESSDPIRYFAGPRRELETEKYQICDKLSLVQRLSPNLRKVYAYSCLSIAGLQEEDAEKLDLQLLLRAERLLEEIVRDEPTDDRYRGMLVMTRRALADEFDARGRSDEAVHWRGQSLATARGNPELFYELATVYGLNARLLGKWPTKLSPAQIETRRRRYEEEAVAMLREAVANGFRSASRLRNEPEFASFRSDPAFQAIILDLEFPANPFAPRSIHDGLRAL